MDCKYCGYPVPDETCTVCPFCGQPLDQEIDHSSLKVTRPVNAFPMKWYKFVIYFQLFVSAFFSALTGIQYFCGFHYGSGNSAMMYAYYGNILRILDIFMGLFSLAMAVQAIAARQKLKYFKQNAPAWYLWTYGLGIISNILYIIFASFIFRMNFMNASTFGNLVGNAIVLILNYIYFHKRASLFIN